VTRAGRFSAPPPRSPSAEADASFHLEPDLQVYHARASRHGECDRYPFSPRIRRLRAILNKPPTRAGSQALATAEGLCATIERHIRETWLDASENSDAQMKIEAWPTDDARQRCLGCREAVRSRRECRYEFRRERSQ
jgi:hypothetical protein